ncbi:MAG TPA: hypothetical protein VNA12_00330 [Mycobacteriales bacterium]|nr:hypothetical protein [Mycobacteriales bacterium]
MDVATNRTARPQRVAAGVVALLLASGCGSTAAPRAVGPGGGPVGGEALGGPAGTTGTDVEPGLGTAPGAGGAGANAPTTSGPRSLGGGAVGTGGTGGGGTSSGGSTSGGGGSSGGSRGSAPRSANPPGVTDTTITIGLAYATNTEARGQQLGVDGPDIGDPLAQQRLIVDDINKRGGILGRKVIVVEHAVDATSTEPYAVQAQEECATFTEDNKVFAVMDGGLDDTLRECVHRAGGVMVEVSTQSYVDGRTFRRFPYYIEPAGMGQDRIAAAWTPALRAQSYFTPWDYNTGQPGALPVKVGVLLLDDPADIYAYENFLAPAIKAAGFPVQSFRASSPKSSGDGAAVAQIQAAVLQFKSDGVTHFLPLDSGAGLALYFGNNANSQRYYPRYGVNSAAGVQTLLDAGLFPREQLNGAMGYGWSPFLDIPDAENPDDGPNSNAARRYCFKLLRDNGQQVNGSIAKRGAAEQCTKLYFLKAALEAGGPRISRASFLAGVHALRGTFEAASTFRTLLGPTNHAGVAGIRNTAYDATCGCFRYTSPLRPL